MENIVIAFASATDMASNHSVYSENTMTVASLITYLERYSADTPIYATVNGEETYAGIVPENFAEDYGHINGGTCYKLIYTAKKSDFVSMSKVERTMTVSDMIQFLKGFDPELGIYFKLNDSDLFVLVIYHWVA